MTLWTGSLGFSGAEALEGLIGRKDKRIQKLGTRPDNIYHGYPRPTLYGYAGRKTPARAALH